MTSEQYAAECRLDVLEGLGKGCLGYVCVNCKERQPENHYWYSATNKDTKENVFPLCAPCVRGDKASKYISPQWKHSGPNKQPVFK